MFHGAIIALSHVCVNAFLKGIAMNFQDRLVSIRKIHNITQKQLAVNIGLSELAIQHYEAGRRKPAFDALIALAGYFDVSLDYLVGRSDDPRRY